MGKHAVEQDAHTERVRVAAERAEIRLVPEERIDALVVAGVVAVVGLRAEDGIQVQRRDPERAQIRQLFADAREIAAEAVVAADDAVGGGLVVRHGVPWL